MATPNKESLESSSAELTAEMRRDFDALRKDVSALTDVMKQYATLQESNLRAAANDRIVSLKSAGEDQLDELRQRAEQTAADAQEMVRKNPGYSVAGAAAIGFIIGALTARR